MTLWARHVQRENPGMVAFPLPRRVDDPLHVTAADWADPSRTHDTLLGQREDVAEPLLRFNALCEGVAALAMFALVWLWVVRSSRGLARSRPRERRRLPAGWPCASCRRESSRLPSQPRASGMRRLRSPPRRFGQLPLWICVPSRPSRITRIFQPRLAARAGEFFIASIGATASFIRIPRRCGQLGRPRCPRWFMFAWTICRPGRSFTIDWLPTTLRARRARAMRNSWSAGRRSPWRCLPGGVQWPDWTVWLRLGVIFRPPRPAPESPAAAPRLGVRAHRRPSRVV